MTKKTIYKIKLMSLIHMLTIVLLSGCCSLNTEEILPSTQNQAGSYHIAVLSVAEWDKYRDDLMPKFEIDSKKALELVVPTTSALEDRIIDSMGGGGGISITLPMETKTGTESKTPSSESTKEASKNVDISIPKSLTENQLAVDPMLRYLAATALYQEVKLLNRYIEDAACKNNKKYEPYIVRLQVSLMPRMKKLPYDFYINFSFFTSKVSKRSEISDVPKVLPLLVTDNLENIMHMKSSDRLRQISAYLALAYQGIGLGADFYEKYEKIQNIIGKDFNSILTVGRLSDNTMRARIGAVRQVEKDYSMIPRTHNITFLILVPKEAEFMEIGSKATMVNVKNGVELPRRKGKEFKNVYKGLIEEYTDSIMITKCDMNMFEQYKNDNNFDERITKYIGEIKTANKDNECTPIPNEPEKDIRACLNKDDQLFFLFQEISDFIESNEWDKFNKVAGCLVKYPDQLWTDFVSEVYAGSQWDVTTFDLPQKKQQNLYNQIALLTDDGESSSTILLQGENLSTKELRTTLNIQKKDNQKNIIYPFVPQSTEILPGCKIAKLTFPSMKKLGLGEGEHSLTIKAENSAIAIQKTNANPQQSPASNAQLTPNEIEQKNPESLTVLYLLKPTQKKSPGYSITVPSSIIAADKSGKGALQLIVKKDADDPAEKIFFEISGAQIEKMTSIPDKIVDLKGNTQWLVTANGILNISLANLNDKAIVTINSYNEKKEKHEQIIKLVSIK